jgi:hypothetical protein
LFELATDGLRVRLDVHLIKLKVAALGDAICKRVVLRRSRGIGGVVPHTSRKSDPVHPPPSPDLVAAPVTVSRKPLMFGHLVGGADAIAGVLK